jgi:exopolysaccharide biosynthesis WecB/TagA/CpsF family protein
MTGENVVILGIPFDNLDLNQAVDRIFELVEDYSQDNRPRLVATVNVDFLVNTHSWRLNRTRHPELLEILRNADLVTADGMPIVWASGLMGRRLKQRVSGSDLVPKIAEEAVQRKKSIYFLGGREDIAEKAANTLKLKFPDLIISGVFSPIVRVEGRELLWAERDDLPIVEIINNSRPDILLIGFGNPKQELWFHRNQSKLNVPVSIGIGGTYEFVAGTVSRAPDWMQNSGLEWLYRLSQDPKRLFRRYFIDFFKYASNVLPLILYYRYLKWTKGG